MRAAFDGAPAFTVGFEDEVMLLDPATFELAPSAREALELLDGDDRFKLELPASQLEIVTPPLATVSDAARCLFAARSALAERTRGLITPAAAGVHPFSSGTGELNDLPRYRHTLEYFGPVAQRQLVCAFQVHVSVGSADLALAVYNAARSYLPLLGALAANAPFYEGRDTGMASVRPKLCELLPRQGVPPSIESWEQLADNLRWGGTAEAFGPGAWWWELRPHPAFGTLEFRVPDSQSTVGQGAAMAAVIQSLVAWLSRRVQDGEQLPAVPEWRIAENRWSACRHGVEGHMADLKTGHTRPTGACLHELLDALDPLARELQCSDELSAARHLVERNGAIVMRELATLEGVGSLGPWLARSFLAPWPG
jgi:glutamate---cysteine ligase / carboxylate-amine ligase